ncbi:hypothetical protein GCM10010840_23520 [Deinococcus aerolatus]|uniref:MarR family transcriptional regulator n=1 Tax=Deinococcus aerolatus TaxID=522487 RepID=A0ABQ2GBE8_9DEIO|nr:hypothetical protein [Deinococcus aerolatus]GGL84919.1 hypothetical protein GCM10010840_23520 [Deinococcus aerolatus]
MNGLRLVLSILTGLAATLVTYSVVFVRGDLGGVMGYLRARGALRRLTEGGADAGAVAAAQDALRTLGAQVGDPAQAARLIPLALLIGLAAGYAVWRVFGRKQTQQGRPDVQERMVYRLAWRKGGAFTLEDLAESSPLDEAQARAVTARMLELGRLTRDGEAFVLRPPGRA